MDTAQRLTTAGVPCGVIMADVPRVDAGVPGRIRANRGGARGSSARGPSRMGRGASRGGGDVSRHRRAVSEGVAPRAHGDARARRRRGLRDAFDELVVGATVRELQADGYLAACDVRTGAATERPRDRRVRGVGAARGTPDGRVLPHRRGVQAPRGEPRHARDRGAAHRRRDAQAAAGQRARALRRGTRAGATNVFVLTEGWDAPREGLSPRARLRPRRGPSCKWSGACCDPYETSAPLVIDLAGVTHEHGLPTRTARSPSTASRASPRRATVALQCLACGLVVEGIKRGPRCPRCGARGLRRRACASSAQRFNRSAASSVPRAVKDAKLRELVSIAHARGCSPTWAGCASGKVRPLAAHGAMR